MCACLWVCWMLVLNMSSLTSEARVLGNSLQDLHVLLTSEPFTEPTDLIIYFYNFILLFLELICYQFYHYRLLSYRLRLRVESAGPMVKSAAVTLWSCMSPTTLASCFCMQRLPWLVKMILSLVLIE